MNKLQQAQELAKKLHSEHLRLSGESYYTHVSKTAKLIQDAGINDETLIILAYLHHLHDLGSEHEKEVKEKFGEEIITLIKKYNDLRHSEIRQIQTKEINQKLIIPTFFNLTKDMRLIILRLADKTSNIQTAHALANESRLNSAERALKLYDPVCQLLGIYHFSHILQEESFKILNPAEYLRIKNYIRKSLPKLKKVLAEIEEVLTNLLKENGIDAKVEWRIKNIYSIYKKITKRNYGIEQLLDIAALRILVNSIEECYKAEDLLKQLWDYIPEQRDDYIQKPRPSGYKSIHNAFLVSKNMPLEVQIKTYEMHEENEFGHASHLVYKIGDLFLEHLKENPELLKKLHYQQSTAEGEMHTFDKNVYVFTPKGDIIELPKGSNLVDFAYSIHAELGNSCVGGIVNGQIQKLDYELKNGDRVEIKTVSSKKKPSEDWLKMVRTRRAKFFIRKALREVT